MKKIIILTILLFNLTVVFGQVCVDSRTMYSNGGLNISYCTIFSGSQGNCKSYTVTISISNTDKDFISLAGSTIYLASNQGDFPPAGKCDRDTSNSNSSGDVRIVFPGQGLGFVTELKPSYNVRQSYVVYTNDTYPTVTYSITPNYMNITKAVKVVPKTPTGQSQNSNSPTNNNSTNNSNQISYQSLQAAVVEFNSLVPSVPEDNEKDVLYNGVKSVLNSNSTSDDYKLKTVNDAIVRFKNKISQQEKSDATNNQKTAENTAAAERQQQAQNAYNEQIRQDQERQNREIADKRQQYSSAFSAGTTAYNSGNYTEAKTQFANAINLANSEQERTPAQNNYNKSNDAIDREIKAKVINDGFNQISAGLAGLDAMIKANREEKRMEKELYQSNKRQEEEKINQQIKNAQNGDCRAQAAEGHRYFTDGKYGLSNYYYEQAFKNKTSECYTNIAKYYATILAILGKKKELISLINNLKLDNNVLYIGLYSYPMLKILSQDYLGDYSFLDEKTILEGVNEIKKECSRYGDSYDKINEFKPFYSYMQVTGEYEKYGIQKDEISGLKHLNKIDIINKNYNNDVSVAARYYLGMIYLNGTSTIEKDEKQALKLFMKAYEKDEKELLTAPKYNMYPAKMYFNYTLLSYLKKGELYSLKKSKSDRIIGNTILDIFFRDFKHLIPKSDLYFFPTIENEITPTEPKSQFDLDVKKLLKFK